MAVINVPQNLSLRNAINFCNRLWSLEDDENYDFDFARLGRVEPFTMAYVANELKRFSEAKPGTCSAMNFEKHSYAAHMGFFRAFGLEHGKEPGEANGSSTYIPLTILNVSDIKKEAARFGEHIGDVLEEKSKRIATILTRQETGDLVDTLTFSIREIMRNVVEHSGSDVIEYCAQYWPTKHLVEVAVLDTGTGIYEGLQSNPYLEMSNERDAVHLALLPGISGKMYKGVKERKHDEWQNSGFGLYMTNRICRNGGDFFICSNDSSVLLGSGKKEDIACTYKGTALRLRIDTNSITAYKDMLARFRKEGYEIAKQFAGEDAVKPSIASTMLARDFQEI